MPRYMRDYVTARAAFLRGEIARWRNYSPGLVIEAFDPQQGWWSCATAARPAPAPRAGAHDRLAARAHAQRPAVTCRGERVRFTAAQLV